MVKDRWEKGEDSISKIDHLSYKYDKEIIKDRFLKAEETIIKKRTYLKDYMEFLKSINKLEEFLNDYPSLREFKL